MPVAVYVAQEVGVVSSCLNPGGWQLGWPLPRDLPPAGGGVPLELLEEGQLIWRL